MNLRPIILLLICYGVFTSITACREEVQPNPIPSDVINPDTMCAIMADVVYLEGARFKKLMAGDSLMTQLEKMELQSLLILKHHNTSFSDFDKSVEWYKHHPQRFLKIYDCILENLSTRKAHLSGQNVPDKPGQHK